MSMTRDKWIKMTSDALVLLRREISCGESKQALDTLRAFDEHLRNPPTFKAEVLWVIKRWLSNASKVQRPTRIPQFTFGTKTDKPTPNTLKFTDEQRDNLLLLLDMIFDGTITLNPKTGAIFPVNGKPGHADKARTLAANSLAQPKKD